LDPHVRAFTQNDILQVAQLRAKVLPSGKFTLDQLLADAKLFLTGPWFDSELPSLVYEDSDGKIRGFAGRLSRSMVMDGKRIRVACSTQLIADPDNPIIGVGRELAYSLASGPQDLSVGSDCNLAAFEVLRRVKAEGMRGLALLFSMRWTRLLRPATYALAAIEQRRRSLLRTAGRLPCKFIDLVATSVPQSPFYRSPTVATDTSGEELDTSTLITHCEGFLRDRRLWPEYKPESLAWLFERLAAKTHRGMLRKVLVRKRGVILGWYIYYAKPGSTGEVLQIVGSKRSLSEVLDHLFDDAYRLGMNAVQGRVDPPLLYEYMAKRCLLQRGDFLVVHSRNSELANAVLRGDAFLSSLEGEDAI